METAIRRTHPRKRPEYGKAVIYIVLLLGCVITLAPFIWMFLTSMKTSMEAVSVPPTILPRSWNTDAYTSLGSKLPFFQMYWNTILTSVIIVAGQLLLCSLAGYAFARIQFPGRNFLFILCLSVLMIPSSFLILFSAFGTFLMRQFFMTIPLELEDAARIDGCGHGRTYLRIMLPLIKPGLVSLGVLTLRFAWNNLMWPMIVNTEKAKMTLSAGLSYLQGQYITDYPSIMAGAMLATIPLIIIYAIFQRQFIEGIALTGIK